MSPFTLSFPDFQAFDLLVSEHAQTVSAFSALAVAAVLLSLPLYSL